MRPAFKLGYFPTIIVSYRRFEDYSVSLGLIHANASLESLVAQYHRTLQSGLWLLNTFGGCVVSYEQLVDGGDRGWARALAAATGIDAEALIAARDRRVEAPSARVLANYVQRQASAAFDAVDALRDGFLPPSAQALRLWQSRLSEPKPETVSRQARPSRQSTRSAARRSALSGSATRR